MGEWFSNTDLQKGPRAFAETLNIVSMYIEVDTTILIEPYVHAPQQRCTIDTYDASYIYGCTS